MRNVGMPTVLNRALSILDISHRVQIQIVKVCKPSPSIPAKCKRSGTFKTQVLLLQTFLQ